MIDVIDIEKKFRSGQTAITVLSAISFHLDTGKTLAVVGKSGSGKTTLLNCLGGLDRPDHGSISCLGTDITALSARKLSAFQRTRLGFVFQYGNLLSYLTVRENILFPLILNRVTPERRNRRVDELLEETQLSHVAESRPRELSGGQAQRAAFARAIAHSPALLLADEPTASLDTETGLSLIQLMNRLGRQQSCTIVISTHDTDIIRHSDTTLHLRDGRISRETDRPES